MNTHIYAFDETKVNPIGTIDLPVYAADRILTVKFFIVDTRSTINAIMGREWIQSIKGVVSTLYQVLRCQSPDGTYTIDIKGDLRKDHRCFNLESEGRVKRLLSEKLSRMGRGKAKVGEETSEGADQ